MQGFVPSKLGGAPAPRSGMLTTGKAPRALYNMQRFLVAGERYQVVVPCYGKDYSYITSTEAGSGDVDEWTVSMPPYTAWIGWGVVARSTGSGAYVRCTRTQVDFVANDGDACDIPVGSESFDFIPATDTSEDATDSGCYDAHKFATNNSGTANDPADGEWHQLTLELFLDSVELAAVVFEFLRLPEDYDV